MGDYSFGMVDGISDWVSRRIPVVGALRHRWMALLAVAGFIANCVAVVATASFPGDNQQAVWLVLSQCAVLCIAILPVIGSCLTVFVWCAATIVGPAATLMPPTYLFSVCLAVGVLEYLMSPAGFPVAIVIGIVTAIGGASLPTGYDAPWLASLTIPLFLCIAVCGHMLAYKERYDAARMELARRRAGEHAARQIHDTISNEIANAILLLRESMDTVNATEQRRLVHLALTHLNRSDARIHEVIQTLEQPDEMIPTQERHPSRPGLPRMESRLSPNAPIHRDTVLRRLNHLAQEQRQALSDCGFDGTLIIPSDLFHEWHSPQFVNLLCGLMEECCTNIRKHANRDFPYVMTLDMDRNAVVLRMSDIVREEEADSDGPDSTVPHTGLRRYRSMIERCGGAMEIRQAASRWSLKATLPYSA